MKNAYVQVIPRMQEVKLFKTPVFPTFDSV